MQLRLWLLGLAITSWPACAAPPCAMPRNVEQIEMPTELFTRTELDQRKGLDWVAGNLAAIERLALVVDDVLVFDLRVDRA